MSDRRARYEAVFREVYEPLQRYAARRARPEAADDVVADTLLVLWRRLDDVPDGMALPWCYGVARRTLANQRRGERRRAGLVDRVMGERGDQASPWSSPIDGPLEAALAELSSDDRELVHLWAWEQLKPAELAVALGTSANAVSIRLHRVRRRLEEALRRKEAAPAGHSAGGHPITAPAKEAP